MDFRRLVLYSNHRAGKYRVNPDMRKRIRDRFLKEGAILVAPERVEEIPGALDRVLDRGEVDVLCIDGGDGTCHKVLTALVPAMGGKAGFPIISPLRGGTTNALANDLDIRGTPYQLLETLLPILREWDGKDPASLPIKNRNLLFIENSERGVEYGFILGFGVLYKGVKRYKGMEPKLRNAFTILSEIVTSAILQAEGEHDYFIPIKARLEVAGEEIQKDSFLGIIASTLKRLIFRISPFEEVPDRGDGYNFIAASLPLGEAVRNILELFRGKTNYNLTEGMIVNRRVKEVEIETGAGYFLDGEIKEPEGTYLLSIKDGPVLKILAPDTPPLMERARAYFGYEEV